MGCRTSTGIFDATGIFLLCCGSDPGLAGAHQYICMGDDEVGAYRRTLSRYTPVGPFYSPREESRLKVVPYQMVRTLSCIPESRYSWAACLMVLGPVLVLLDFFV